jgi:hypothetical protein
MSVRHFFVVLLVTLLDIECIVSQSFMYLEVWYKLLEDW